MEKKKEKRRRGWCYTLNNPTPQELTHLTALTSVADKHVAQVEIGEQKTRHVQGFIKWKHAKTFSATKSALGGRVHLEACKHEEASIRYCIKPEGFVAVVARKGAPREPRVLEKLRPWQEHVWKQICSDIKEEDDRTIHWYWDPVGNTGKTAFVKWLIIKHGAVFLGGKAADAKYAIAVHLREGTLPDEAICVWNLPRTQEGYVSYAALESVKDGLIFSNKYESGGFAFNSPVVIVFANFPPERERLSADRWDVLDIAEWAEEHERQQAAALRDQAVQAALDDGGMRED